MSVKCESMISWRVTSVRNECSDAGYWTASYMDRDEAIEHAECLEGKAYEVTQIHDWTRDPVTDVITHCQFVYETWVRIDYDPA